MRLLRVSGNGGPQEKLEIVGNRGLFLTERIPPGTYEVHAEGYAPLTAEQKRFTGIAGPTLTAQSTVTVPESGVVPSLKLKLKKPAPPAERQRNAETPALLFRLGLLPRGGRGEDRFGSSLNRSRQPEQQTQ